MFLRNVPRQTPVHIAYALTPTGGKAYDFVSRLPKVEAGSGLDCRRAFIEIGTRFRHPSREGATCPRLSEQAPNRGFTELFLVSI